MAVDSSRGGVAADAHVDWLGGSTGLRLPRHQAPQRRAAAGKAQPGLDHETKDSIILADFVNHTGDPVFDTTLNQALQIDLEQSPVINIVSQQHLLQSVKYLGKPEGTPVTPAIARGDWRARRDQGHHYRDHRQPG